MNKKIKSNKRPIKILWIPGLGANEVMYSEIIQQLESSKYNFHHYYFRYFDVEPNCISSLEEYSEFLYKKNKEILKTHYDLVVGTSLGGMIVQILFSKKLIKSKKYVLLSTAFSHKDLTIVSKFFIFLAKLIPPFLRRTLQNGISFSYRFFRFYLKNAKELSIMFKEFPNHVFFEAPFWIYNWRGIQKSEIKRFNFFLYTALRIHFYLINKYQKLENPIIQ